MTPRSSLQETTLSTENAGFSTTNVNSASLSGILSRRCRQGFMSVRSVSILLFLAASAPMVSGQPKIEFNRNIRPILAENCFACHGPDPGAHKADMPSDSGCLLHSSTVCASLMRALECSPEKKAGVLSCPRGCSGSGSGSGNSGPSTSHSLREGSRSGGATLFFGRVSVASAAKCNDDRPTCS